MLPLPRGPRDLISMDFIADLPLVMGYNSILTVVDRFNKVACFISCTKKTTAEETHQLLMTHVFSIFGIPSEIVSDRGPQFIARFWNELFKYLDMNPSQTSGYHPQSNGKAERTNQILKHYLCCYVNYC